MNAELRAYIEAVVSDCPKKKARKPGLVATLKSLFREWLASGDHFFCEFRNNRAFRRAMVDCCKTKQAIGFHGLA